MKVVLFCGGSGMRIREFSDAIPKPLVPIGYRPILWHVMKYYAYFGHNDFILCLGHRGDAIKQYFLNYSECLSNDFVLSAGGKAVQLLGSDIDEWRITFVDTGITSTIGQRLKAVEPFLQQEEIFLANYADGLTNLSFSEYLNHFIERKKIATFLCVKPSQSFHVVSAKDDVVRTIDYVDQSDVWINGGFFIFRRELFKYIQDGEDLVEEPFHRLIQEEELLAYKYRGFWASMDTFKEKQRLEDMCAANNAPWELWKLKKNGDRG